MRFTINIIKVVSIWAVASTAVAEPIIFPAKGQSQQQLEQDKYACYSWAKTNTGFDPMQASAPSAAPQQSSGGGLIRGAGRGAALGAVGGAIAGDAGTGAAVGAATGALARGFRNRDQKKQQQQANAQSQQQYNAAHQTYDRAYAACLEGKGYTVK